MCDQNRFLSSDQTKCQPLLDGGVHTKKSFKGFSGLQLFLQFINFASAAMTALCLFTALPDGSAFYLMLSFVFESSLRLLSLSRLSFSL